MGGFLRGFRPPGHYFFYAVVIGWCMYYFTYTFTNQLPVDLKTSMAVWDHYQAGNWPLLTHFMAVILEGPAILRGISSIEKVNRILVPSLLVIVFISVVRAITLPGSGEGIDYLFRPDWKALGDPKTWIDALTQNAWDTVAGWGMFLTYAAYMKKDQGTVKNAFVTGIGNNTVSLLAGIMIFGTILSVL
jgi:NSS family neurotransmitter:Na+ symporter